MKFLQNAKEVITLKNHKDIVEITYDKSALVSLPTYRVEKGDKVVLNEIEKKLYNKNYFNIHISYYLSPRGFITIKSNDEQFGIYIDDEHVIFISNIKWFYYDLKSYDECLKNDNIKVYNAFKYIISVIYLNK